MSSFNILYVVEKIAALFAGTSVSSLQSDVLTYAQYAEWWALGISVVLLIGYIPLRLLGAEEEHRLHHMRTEAELAAHGAAHTTAKNPRFEAAVALANSSQEGDWRRAIIEADSLLADLLRNRGFVGDDIGEQLKGASTSHFATLDLAWDAHRMRNRIAHEGEQLVLTSRDALATMDQYRRVFEEFNYI